MYELRQEHLNRLIGVINLKLAKQISPLLGMMIITKTRTPENGIGNFCC